MVFISVSLIDLFRIIISFSNGVRLYSVGKEHALIIGNHRSYIDWLVGWTLAQVSAIFLF